MRFIRKALRLEVPENETGTPAPASPETDSAEPTPETPARTRGGTGGSGAFPYAVGAVSERGGHRSSNEDTLFHLESVLDSETDSFPFGVFIVADGLGGQRDGQIASELSVRAAASYLVKTVYAPVVAGHVQDSEMPPLNESLAKSVELANRAVLRGTQGGGSTLTALVLLDRTAYVVHVGDTRAYAIDTGSLSLLTRDHSLASRLMEVQGSSEQDVAHLPERHTLYKALGQPTSPEPDIHYHSIALGSHLLLCSDGLWGFVSERDILEAFRTLDDAQRVCTHLAELAISHGSDDNVSLMALVSRVD